MDIGRKDSLHVNVNSCLKLSYLLKVTKRNRKHNFLINFAYIQCAQCPCTVSYKNTNHQQMHKESFIINRNALLHVSALLGHLQGELFVIVTLRLQLQLSENVLLTVYCIVFGGVNSLRSRPAVHSQQHLLAQL
jgi:hypothetical protein